MAVTEAAVHSQSMDSLLLSFFRSFTNCTASKGGDDGPSPIKEEKPDGYRVITRDLNAVFSEYLVGTFDPWIGGVPEPPVPDGDVTVDEPDSFFRMNPAKANFSSLILLGAQPKLTC